MARTNKYIGDYSAILPDHPTCICTANHHNDILYTFRDAYSKVCIEVSAVSSAAGTASLWAEAPAGSLISGIDYSSYAYRGACLSYVNSLPGTKVVSASGIETNYYSMVAYSTESHDRVLCDAGGQVTTADGSYTADVSVKALITECDSITDTGHDYYDDRYGVRNTGENCLPYSSMVLSNDVIVGKNLVMNCGVVRDTPCYPTDATEVYRFSYGCPEPPDGHIVFPGRGKIGQVLDNKNVLKTVPTCDIPMGLHGVVIETDTAQASQLIETPTMYTGGSEAGWVFNNAVTTANEQSPNTDEGLIKSIACPTSGGFSAYTDNGIDDNYEHQLVVGCWLKNSNCDSVTVKAVVYIDGDINNVISQDELHTSCVNGEWCWDYVKLDNTLSPNKRVRVTIESTSCSQLTFYGVTAWTDGISDPSVGKVITAGVSEPPEQLVETPNLYAFGGPTDGWEFTNSTIPGYVQVPGTSDYVCTFSQVVSGLLEIYTDCEIDDLWSGVITSSCNLTCNSYGYDPMIVTVTVYRNNDINDVISQSLLHTNTVGGWNFDSTPDMDIGNPESGRKVRLSFVSPTLDTFAFYDAYIIKEGKEIPMSTPLTIAGPSIDGNYTALVDIWMPAPVQSIQTEIAVLKDNQDDNEWQWRYNPTSNKITFIDRSLNIYEFTYTQYMRLVVSYVKANGYSVLTASVNDEVCTIKPTVVGSGNASVFCIGSVMKGCAQRAFIYENAYYIDTLRGVI